VRGKTLLHLQCHFGIDTISWARQRSRRRARWPRSSADARFAVSNIYDSPGTEGVRHRLRRTALTWLPRKRRWAEVARTGKPGSTFYIVEFTLRGS
jgi:hypothetical protein